MFSAFTTSSQDWRRSARRTLAVAFPSSDAAAADAIWRGAALLLEHDDTLLAPLRRVFIAFFASANRAPAASQLVHVAPPTASEHLHVPLSSDVIAADETPAPEAAAREMSDRERDGGASSTLVLRGTDAADALIRFASARDVDIVVCGSHAHIAPVRALLGSVSDALVRRAGAAVLVVRTSGRPLLTAVPPGLHAFGDVPRALAPAARKVVIGLDASPPALAMTLLVIDKVLRPRDEVTAVVVVEGALESEYRALYSPPARECSPGRSATEWAAFASARPAAFLAGSNAVLVNKWPAVGANGGGWETPDACADKLAEFACRWPLADHPPQFLLLHGPPSHALCKHAEAAAADLLIVGSHGQGSTLLGSIARGILGSVSLDVVQNAPCPVLVIRNDAAIVKY